MKQQRENLSISIQSRFLELYYCSDYQADFLTMVIIL